MTERQYQVGQILYVGSNKKNQIVPIQVVKITTEETIEGNLVTYFVVTPKDLKTSIDLKKINGQIFMNLDEAKRTMINNAERASQNFLKNAKEQINKMVVMAEKATHVFPHTSPQQSFVEDDQIDLDVSDQQDAYASPLSPNMSDGDDDHVISGPDGPIRIRSISVSPPKVELKHKTQNAK